MSSSTKKKPSSTSGYVSRPKKSPFIGPTFDQYLVKQFAEDPSRVESFNRECLKLELARQVKTLRAAKRLTQAQLAERMGMKQSQIARLEKGSVMPGLDLLNKVAGAMGMKLDVRFVQSRFRKAPRAADTGRTTS